jgi:hypothetical protein
MRRIDDLMQAVFWASVPPFGAYLAPSWAFRGCSPGWLGYLLWFAAVASSAYLTLRFFPPPREE